MSGINGFHSEWVTEGVHRILLESRAGYPDSYMRFLAKVAAMTCDCNSFNKGREGGARVTHIFYDNKACVYLIRIASTDPEDEQLGKLVYSVFDMMLDGSPCQPEVQIIEKGNSDSDHYNHMEHLSVESGIAVDRWRHGDADYVSGTSSPR